MQQLKITVFQFRDLLNNGDNGHRAKNLQECEEAIKQGKREVVIDFNTDGSLSTVYN